MKKCLIIIFMVLIILQIATALKDCESIMNPSDIPCSIINSWQYENTCNTYIVKIYNSTPLLLETKTMGNFGSIGKCNVTFNYSKIGSYLLNFSSGDTATINVEADDMNYITIGIMLAIITFVFAYFATKVNQWFLQIGLSLLTFVMIIFDFFISARIIEAVDSAQTGIIYYLDTFFFIAVTLFRFLLGGTVIYLIYYMYKHIITNPLRKRTEEEEKIYE